MARRANYRLVNLPRVAFSRSGAWNLLFLYLSARSESPVFGAQLHLAALYELGLRRFLTAFDVRGLG